MQGWLLLLDTGCFLQTASLEVCCQISGKTVGWTCYSRCFPAFPSPLVPPLTLCLSSKLSSLSPSLCLGVDCKASGFPTLPVFLLNLVSRKNTFLVRVLPVWPLAVDSGTQLLKTKLQILKIMAQSSTHHLHGRTVLRLLFLGRHPQVTSLAHPCLSTAPDS